MPQVALNQEPFKTSDGLTELRTEFQHRTGVDALTAEIAVDFYQKFMALKKTPYRAFTPSELIDAVWHIHLENPAAYHRFCQELVGSYIRHTPGGSPERLAAGWENTLSGFQRHYGINLEETRFGNSNMNGIACRSDAPGDCY